MVVSPKVDSNGKTRTLPNTKPYAMRLREPRGEPRPGLPNTMAIKGIDVGERHTEFDSVDGVVTIAGTTFTVLEWFEFRYRVDLLFERAGCLERVRPPGNRDTEGSSSFLTKNVKTILRLDRGMIVEIPAPNGPYDEAHIEWVKERYSMLITKEQYGN